jgi:hypothetical protein
LHISYFMRQPAGEVMALPVAGLAVWEKRFPRSVGSAMSYGRLLGVVDIRALLLAASLSRLASRMFALTIVLCGLKRFDSPAVAGWLSFAGLAPGLIVSPIAGALLDRIGPAWAITVDMVASAFLVIALVMADQLNVANTPLLCMIIILFSVTSPFSTAGIRTLLPRMVPVSDLDSVNALDTSIYAVVDVLRPALAGAMVGFVGSELALTLIGLIYVLAAFSLANIRSSSTTIAPRSSLLHQSLEGIVTVVRRPTLRAVWLFPTRSIKSVGEFW